MATLPSNLAEKLALLKAKKAQEIQNESTDQSTGISVNSSTDSVSESIVSTNGMVCSSSGTGNSNLVPVRDSQSGKDTSSELITEQQTKTLLGAGSHQTVDINHLDFLSKLNELQEKIHTQHPQMPMLLRQIHKQLMEDPELVTLLNEESIGVVVKGLEIQTKTELISQTMKEAESKSKVKKLKVDVDMF